MLVNNAGYSQSGAVESVPMDKLRLQFETNVFGLVRMCQLALPGMRAQGWGKIVNLSSMGGRLTFPGGGAYHATKYAVEALSDALRFEVAGLRRRRDPDRAGPDPDALRRDRGRRDRGAGEGPYGEFNRGVAASTAAYESGALGRLGGSPETVAEKIGKALAARRPRARYTVTPSGGRLIASRALLPDTAWDAMMRTQFRQPGGER